MDTTAAIAIITTSGTVLVAAISALAAIFGDRWRESKRARAEAQRAQERARYDALAAFTSALLKSSYAKDLGARVATENARLAFVATLHPGEGAVADFTRAVVDEVHDDRESRQRNIIITSRAGDDLFAYLRGDKRMADLSVRPPTTWIEPEPDVQVF